MKYTATSPPARCFMRQSSWYKGTTATTVRGVLWHSTGANNPELRRYVQPDDNAPDRDAWLNALGKNVNKNDWNHITNQAGVHAWIGKLADGTVTSVQVGEWDKRAWGCGSGKNGSCNSGWVQFEICEDALTDASYFEKVYREGCELTAYLCKTYNLNPQGTVSFNGVNVPVILCHHDSYKLGLGSGHVDVDHWFEKHGKTMWNVREDVAALLSGNSPWEGDSVERWQTVNDVPDGYYRKQVKRLMSAGVLVGTGVKDGSPIIDLTKDMLRTILICERLKK